MRHLNTADTSSARIQGNGRKPTAPDTPGPGTRALHAGARRGNIGHSLTPPIIQSAAYTFRDTDDLITYKSAGDVRLRQEYGRYGNPTVRAVEERLAALEGGEEAILLSSGLSLIHI